MQVALSFMSSAPNYLFIGLRLQNDNNQWEWADGTPFDYGTDTSGGVYPWAGDDMGNGPHPNINCDSTNPCCVMMVSGSYPGWIEVDNLWGSGWPLFESGGLKNVLCSDTATTTPTTMSPITTSPIVSVQVLYNLTNAAVDCWSADAQCQAEYPSSQVASIHSYDEMQVAQAFVGVASSYYIWIGLQNDNHQWEWADGTPFDYGWDTTGGVFPWSNNGPNWPNSLHPQTNCNATNPCCTMVVSGMGAGWIEADADGAMGLFESTDLKQALCRTVVVPPTNAPTNQPTFPPIPDPICMNGGYFTQSNDWNNPASPGYQQCVYQCQNDFGNSEFYPYQLSFGFIYDECHWEFSRSPGNCSSLDDLVWPDWCSCPRCRCDNPGTVIIQNKKSYFEQECEKCTCASGFTQNETGWRCRTEYQVNTIEDWNQYVCANNTLINCTDPITGEVYDPGRGYWRDPTPNSNVSWAGSGPRCQTYCYCNFDGTIDCEYTYANILNSSNVALTNGFRENCDWSASSCFNDTSLMFNDSYSHWSCDCPMCRCPQGTNLNGKWSFEYTEPKTTEFDGGDSDTRCYDCQCVSHQNETRASCDDNEHYSKGMEVCPMPVHTNCSEGFGMTGNVSQLSLNSTGCRGNEEGNYCGWQAQAYDNDGSAMFMYGWGCTQTLMCEIFTMVGTDSITEDCVHIQIDQTVNSECGGNDDFLMDSYMYCCEGDHCNTNKDANISQCREDTFVNGWYYDYMQCKFAAEHQQFFCSDIDATYTCEDIALLGTSYLMCECTSFGAIFNRTSDYGQDFFQTMVDSRFEELHAWADLFGCNLTWHCELNTTGDLYLNGNLQTSAPTESPTPAPSSPPTESPTFAPDPVCFGGSFTRSHGYWDTNSPDYQQCIYRCYGGSNYTEIPLSPLRFEFISNQCDLGNTLSNNCSTLDDLVWPDSCDCPRCSCDTQTGITWAHNKKSYFEQQCESCACQVVNEQGDQGWLCNDEYMVNTIEQWNDYICTNTTIINCTDPITGLVSNPGHSYWRDPCPTFCYCNFDGILDCEYTYAQISKSSNLALANRFMDECAEDASSCFNDTSLMFNDPFYEGGCGCPKCRCPQGTILNDKWFYEYTQPKTTQFGNGEESHEDTYCYQCECVSMANETLNQASCNHGESMGMGWDSEYIKGLEVCPMPLRTNCSQGFAQTANASQANLVPIGCYGNQNGDYCGWIKELNDETPFHMWTCMPALNCEVFTLVGTDSVTEDCVHLHFNESITSDCGEDFFLTDQYIFCCEGDHCNNRDADSSQCREDAFVNEWYTDFINCKYAAEHQQFLCSNDDATYTCADIELLGTSYLSCECAAWGAIYNRSSYYGQGWLQADMDQRFESLHEWATFFGCNLTWTCDLNITGLLSLNGEIQTPLPTQSPTLAPTSAPSMSPTLPTADPTSSPTTNNPTKRPTNDPTKTPSNDPLPSPTFDPTSLSPTKRPSLDPTMPPSHNPSQITASPSIPPTTTLSDAPTTATVNPTNDPSSSPSDGPTQAPTVSPSSDPSQTTLNPSMIPTNSPINPTTAQPSVSPTKHPSFTPSESPTFDPTMSPSTASPSEEPSPFPTINPSTSPTFDPSVSPTMDPTSQPSEDPTFIPSQNPSVTPSKYPTQSPSVRPTLNPSIPPTQNPSVSPTEPTEYPTSSPSATPTYSPTGERHFNWGFIIKYLIKHLEKEFIELLLEHIFDVTDKIIEFIEKSYVENTGLQLQFFRLDIDDMLGVEIDDISQENEPQFINADNGIEMNSRVSCAGRHSGEILHDFSEWKEGFELFVTLKMREYFVTFVQNNLNAANEESEVEFEIDVTSVGSLVSLDPISETTIQDAVSNSQIIVAILVMFAVLSIITFFAYMHNQNSVNDYIWYALMIYGLQLAVMASDINLCLEIFGQDSFVSDVRISLCGIACVVFLLIPYGINLYFAGHVSELIPTENKNALSFFQNRNQFFLILCVICGGFYPTVFLCSSGIFGIKTFDSGVTYYELRKMNKIKVFSTICLQHIPQIIIQCVYTATIHSITVNCAFAFIVTVLSVLSTPLHLYIYNHCCKHHRHVYFKYYIEIQKVLTETDSDLEIHNFMDKQERTTEMRDILCESFGYPQSYIEISRSANITTNGVSLYVIQFGDTLTNMSQIKALYTDTQHYLKCAFKEYFALNGECRIIFRSTDGMYNTEINDSSAADTDFEHLLKQMMGAKGLDYNSVKHRQKFIHDFYGLNTTNTTQTSAGETQPKYAVIEEKKYSVAMPENTNRIKMGEMTPNIELQPVKHRKKESELFAHIKYTQKELQQVFDDEESSGSSVDFAV